MAKDATMDIKEIIEYKFEPKESASEHVLERSLSPQKLEHLLEKISRSKRSILLIYPSIMTTSFVSLIGLRVLAKISEMIRNKRIDYGILFILYTGKNSILSTYGKPSYDKNILNEVEEKFIRLLNFLGIDLDKSFFLYIDENFSRNVSIYDIHEGILAELINKTEKQPEKYRYLYTYYSKLTQLLHSYRRAFVTLMLRAWYTVYILENLRKIISTEYWFSSLFFNYKSIHMFVSTVLYTEAIKTYLGILGERYFENNNVCCFYVINIKPMTIPWHFSGLRQYLEKYLESSSSKNRSSMKTREKSVSLRKSNVLNIVVDLIDKKIIDKESIILCSDRVKNIYVTDLYELLTNRKEDIVETVNCLTLYIEALRKYKEIKKDKGINYTKNIDTLKNNLAHILKYLNELIEFADKVNIMYREEHSLCNEPIKLSIKTKQKTVSVKEVFKLFEDVNALVASAKGKAKKCLDALLLILEGVLEICDGRRKIYTVSIEDLPSACIKLISASSNTRRNLVEKFEKQKIVSNKTFYKKLADFLNDLEEIGITIRRAETPYFSNKIIIKFRENNYSPVDLQVIFDNRFNNQIGRDILINITMLMKKMIKS
ncbi:hypothetical protein J4526_07455 [Desulfurococcaceae archaeon MEX13E-LK6-19]|nr:hypothetical protein J4526_07455 [Desulfurococcaceae archaeon MEX13E-LK6-19]